MIRESVMKIVQSKQKVKPFGITPEVTLEIEFNEGDYLCEANKQFPGVISNAIISPISFVPLFLQSGDNLGPCSNKSLCKICCN